MCNKPLYLMLKFMMEKKLKYVMPETLQIFITYILTVPARTLQRAYIFYFEEHQNFHKM